MGLKSFLSNRKVSAFIIIFPPLILLIYGLASYNIFFSHIDKDNKNFIESYEVNIGLFSKDVLETRALTINNVVNALDNIDDKFVLILLKSIEIKDGYSLAFTKDNKVLFKTSNILDKKTILKLSKLEGYYGAKNFLSYTVNKNNKDIVVVVYSSKNKYFTTMNKIKSTISKNTEESIRSSIYLLGITWFLLLILSLFLSVVVYNRLKKYEETIDSKNSRIILSSKQALLGELLPMIAHQWRQPLNKIASVLVRMRFEISKEKPNSNTLDIQSKTIEDSVEMMSQTIDDFRTFYRPKEDPTYADLSLLVRKAIYFLSELIDRKKIKLVQELSPASVKIYENEFLQVIINLIKNAADAVLVRGNIYILLREVDRGKVELRIEDDGIGIPDEKLEKIFEAHESSKQASMGLGLYMSRLIIEKRLGGTIKAYNTSRGAGFIITLNN